MPTLSQRWADDLQKISNLRANVVLLNQLTVKSNQSNSNRRRSIILKLACSELFCLDSVVSATGLMVFQSSCKQCIAESFAFKQKRSVQLSVH